MKQETAMQMYEGVKEREEKRFRSCSVMVIVAGGTTGRPKVELARACIGRKHDAVARRWIDKATSDTGAVQINK